MARRSLCGAVVVLAAVLAAARCFALAADIEWARDSDTDTTTSCSGFTALARSGDTFWIAGDDCLLRVPTLTKSQVFVGAEMSVKGIAALGTDHVWAAGNNRKRDRRWGEISEWRDGHWTRGLQRSWSLPDIVYSGMETWQGRQAWAFGQFSGSGDPALVRISADGQGTASMLPFGKGNLEALSTAPDGCAFAIVRRPDETTLLARFDRERWLAVSALDDRPKTVHAVSCEEAWYAGTTLAHYRKGAWEQMPLPANARIETIVDCGATGLLAAGALQSATPDSRGEMWRLGDHRLEPLGVQHPPELASWGVRRVVCGADTGWAIAESYAPDVATGDLPVLFQLYGDELRYRAYSHSRFEYYVHVLFDF